MITYAEKIINKEDVEIFREIQQVIDQLELPDIGNEKEEKREVSCHMLADAISRIYDVKVERGYYITIYEHSWLRTKNYNVIDIYPIAMVGGPFLIDRDLATGRGPTYVLRENLDYLYPFSKQDYDHAVDLVEAALREALEKCRQNMAC